MPTLVWACLALLVVTIVVQIATTNSYLRRKLRLSVYLLLASLAITAAAAYPPFQHELRDFATVPRLLLALAIINTLVVCLVNPLRQDRISDSFPNIVQDAIIVGTFFIVATLIFHESILTASAVSAVVVGFALQDTLGNAFAGLAIQVEKPFRVGHWIKVGDFEGKVSLITWRATKLLTRSGTYVIVPNNIVSKEAITNYSEPVLPVRIAVEVGVAYGLAPNIVKRAMREAVDQAPLALKAPAPTVDLVQFGDSSIVYRALFWISEFETEERAHDQVRTAIYYAFRRHNIEIPYPIQIEMSREDAAFEEMTADERLDAIGRVDIFASLDAEARSELAAGGRGLLFAQGEIVVRQGAAGESMFLVRSGEVKVTLDPGGEEVARIGPGGFFGEMSLLTGDPRTATVTATMDSRLMEIDAERFRRIALANPAAVDAIGLAVVTRRAGLDKTRAAAALRDASLREQSQSLINRVKRFLGLPAV